MLTQLANVLSDIVTTEEGIRDALADAGLSGRHVALEGSPYEMWRSALESAQKDGKLFSLVGVMRGRYPGNQQLFEAERVATVAQSFPLTGRPPVTRQEWEGEIALLNMRVSFVEERQRENRGILDRLVERREADWSRFMLLVGAAAGLAAFLTAVLNRLAF